jgi:hypothetical protein
MHGLTILGAFFVSEAGAGDETASRFVGMIEGGEKAPVRLACVHSIIISGPVCAAVRDGLFELLLMGESCLRKAID